MVEFEIKGTRGRAARGGYKENEAGYFVIYCPQPETVYAMEAWEGVFGKLRAQPTGNNQRLFMKRAEDYSFEKHVAALKVVEQHRESGEGKEGVV